MYCLTTFLERDPHDVRGVQIWPQRRVRNEERWMAMDEGERLHRGEIG